MEKTLPGDSLLFIPTDPPHTGQTAEATVLSQMDSLPDYGPTKIKIFIRPLALPPPPHITLGMNIGSINIPRPQVQSWVLWKTDTGKVLASVATDQQPIFHLDLCLLTATLCSCFGERETMEVYLLS